MALNPATSLTSLDYLLPSLDYVLLMLINPGFAGDKNETQVPYAMEKVRNLREKICGLDASVAIGRWSGFFASIGLIAAGANNLVLGSTGLFIKGATLADNKTQLDRHVSEGLAQSGGQQ